MKLILSRSLLAASLMLLPVNGQTTVSALPSTGIVLNVNADQDVTINPDGMSTFGTISHGGILNGTTTDVFMSSPVPVANTDTLALTDTLTIRANHGTLTCSDVTLFNPAQGVFTTISTINSGSGIFKGATGTLFISGTSTDGVHYQDKITGQITIFLR
jgi:hypothetical protein